MRRLLPRFSGAALILALALAHSTTALASVNGNIAGVVTDEATNKPLAGATITVTSPALQGEQTEFSDSAGRFIITELPPGEYTVRAYFSNIKVERLGIFVSADKTLQVNMPVPTQKAKTQTYRITERAPTVDVGNTQVQTQVTNELVRNTPVRGRTYESVLTLAPGSTTDAVGFSFNGATGPENNFLVDGLNTTSPAFGLVGTPLSLEFIGETEIITGGYNAEYGRATGGVVNVVTKSGSNDFHGGAWFYYQPFQLQPELVARTGEALGRREKISNAFDFGFDLGGPILKDRIWFYVGFDPSFSTTENLRYVRHRTANNVDPMMTTGTYNGDIDTSAKCPSWLTGGSMGTICKALSGNPATGPFATVLSSNAPKNYPEVSRSYQYIAKLNFNINENNSLALHYIGNPSSSDAVQSFNGAESYFRYKSETWNHDVGLHYISKLLDRKLQIDLLLGYHYSSDKQSPQTAAGSGPEVRDTRTASLALFEPELMADCAIQQLNGGVRFNPCPVSSYRYGGVGFLSDTADQRISGQLGITYFARLAGTHAIKLGFDFEDNIYRDKRFYTGAPAGGAFTILGDGTVERQQFGTVMNAGTPMEQVVELQNGFEATTKTFNEGFYLRDSYNVGFVPGLTINAGIRWELQQVKDINDKTQISITDNIAPRLGFIYDFTQKGRSKIFASYGRFYESIPLDLNDRQFSGEGLLITDQASADPKKTMCSGNGPMGQQMVDTSTCKWGPFTRSDLNGGTFGAVAPSLKGMYSNEVVAGLQYDVGLDLVLGATYIHRDLGRIIEDMSPDGGQNYIIANPGDDTDTGAVKDLQNQIAKESDPVKKQTLQQQLSLYKGVQSFEKPKRDYNALVLTANKRLSHNFIVVASYTYSRTVGNYPGLFQASNGQLDPNISTQYDLVELLQNRNGPLPNDRPHNLKITGAYNIPLGGGGLTLGLNFNAISGRPIEVLGRHPTYGRLESFVLPRGSGGRTPTLTSLDFHVAYGRNFGKMLRLDIYWDTFNVLNQHGVTNVDDEYTADRVNPIANGNAGDLAQLKTTAGVQARINPNYGQPTGFQSPLSMRFGIRVSF